jgi:2-dehydropantoate 2-reductase
MKIKNILLVGTGAVGSLYGGKLAQAGVRVTALCRSDYEVVKEKGIGITSIWGDFRFFPEKVIRHAGELEDQPDAVVVALKVLPDVRVGEIIGPAVGQETAVVLIQNGVEIEGDVARAFPENEIISGLAFVCAGRTALGEVHHIDYGKLILGNFPSGVSERTRLLAGLFKSAGVPCSVSEDIVKERWKKLVWNAPFSPLSVLGGGVDTREILGDDESAKLVREAMEEVCLVAKALGHELPSSVVEKNIADSMKMKPYKTSMCLDFEAGRPMEVECILGNAVRAARRASMDVPCLETLYALLRLMDKRVRKQFN